MHFDNLSASSFDKPSKDTPEPRAKPWDTSWEFMYWNVELELMDSTDELSEYGDP